MLMLIQNQSDSSREPPLVITGSLVGIERTRIYFETAI